MFIAFQSCMLILVGVLLWGQPVLPPLSQSSQQLVRGMTEQEVIAILGDPKIFSDDYAISVSLTSSNPNKFEHQFTIHQYYPVFKNGSALKIHKGLPSYSFTIDPLKDTSLLLNKELVWMDEKHALLLVFDLSGKLGRIELVPLTVQPTVFADTVEWAWYKTKRFVGW